MKKYLIPFILVTSLFFLWAFVHALEPILIPHLKKACQLTDFQSALIDSSVYIGYFLMALPAGVFIRKFGYKKAIVFGLLLYAFGAYLFYPAASTRAYPFFLGALFIIASGCAFLETAANPYVTFLGDEKTATTRLNFSQSFNGLGNFVAPLIGGVFILSGIEHSNADYQNMNAQEFENYLQFEADAVKMPYVIIGSAVLFICICFAMVKMPEVNQQEESGSRSSLRDVLSFTHLRKGVIAQFFYVGAQVCVISFFIRFSRYAADIPEKQAAYLLGIAMFGFMIGRFTGTALTRLIAPEKLLAIYSGCSILLLALAMTLRSKFAVWCLMGVPFFESVMFPTIFALAIKQLKEHTGLGSSLLVMAVSGGALFPLIMGAISDSSNIQLAYIVPLLCFLVVGAYGLRGYKVKEHAVQTIHAREALEV